MKIHKPNIDDNPVLLIGALVTMAALAGVFGPVHWTEWGSWSWDAIAGHFVGLILFTAFVWVTSFQITEQFSKDELGNLLKRSRPAAYFLCFVFVVFVSVALGCIWSAPVEAGDQMDYGGPTATEDQPAMSLEKRDALIWKMIVYSMLPAMFGVRSALGPKPPKGK